MLLWGGRHDPLSKVIVLLSTRVRTKIAAPVCGRQGSHSVPFSVRHARECRVVEVPRAVRGNGYLHSGHVTRHGTPLGVALRADLANRSNQFAATVNHRFEFQKRRECDGCTTLARNHCSHVTRPMRSLTCLTRQRPLMWAVFLPA
jgi:hypothetical protein